MLELFQIQNVGIGAIVLSVTAFIGSSLFTLFKYMINKFFARLDKISQDIEFLQHEVIKISVKVDDLQGIMDKGLNVTLKEKE